jgi:WD40-like Beta Propeller Repeat
MNSDGSEITPLTTAGPDNYESSDPTFSPDGTRIAFARRTSNTFQHAIWVMNPDGTGQTPLTAPTASTTDAAPSFSPDGARIAYDHAVIGSPNDENVFVMNADGSGQTQLTSGPGQDLEPAFSPDGTRVAVDRQDQTYSLFSDIVTAGSNGLDQDVTPLTQNSTGVYDSTPDWQPLNPPSCELTGQPKQKSLKQVTLTVTCADENATAVVEGSGKAPKVPKGAVASKAKKFTIPPVTAQVPEATPANLTLTIPKKAKTALKKAAKAGKKGKATFSATFTDDLGQSSHASFAVEFKKKRK